MQNKVVAPSRESLKNLVESLGGKQILRTHLLDFYETMSKDLMIGFFFEGKDLNQISSRQADFVLMAAGLNKEYLGKGPNTAHLAMPPILSGHFDRRLVILKEVLERKGIDPKLIETWLQFEESFRAIVVQN